MSLDEHLDKPEVLLADGDHDSQGSFDLGVCAVRKKKSNEGDRLYMDGFGECITIAGVGIWLDSVVIFEGVEEVSQEGQGFVVVGPRIRLSL